MATKHKWNPKEFGEIAGLRNEKYNPANGDSEYPCIEMEHLSQVTPKLLGTISSKEQKSIKNTFYPKDILFGKLRPYLRKYLMPDFKGVCSTEIWVLRPRQGVDGKYLFYLIQSERFMAYANTTSGSKMPRADWNYISNISFPLPPLPEQKRIVRILETWDEAIEKSALKISEYENLLLGLRQNLVNKRVRLEQFTAPWDKIEAEKFMTVKATKVDPNTLSAETKCIELEHIEQGTGRLLGYTDARNQKSIKNEFGRDDIIFGKLRPYLKKFWRATFDGVCTTEAWVIRGTNKATNEFLYYLIQDERFMAWANVSSGTHMPRADWDFLRGCAFSIPTDVNEQNAIAHVLNTTESIINEYRDKKAVLESQKQFLLNNLVTGKIPVPEEIEA